MISVNIININRRLLFFDMHVANEVNECARHYNKSLLPIRAEGFCIYISLFLNYLVVNLSCH